MLAPAHPPTLPFHFFPKSSSPAASAAVRTRVVTVPHHVTRTAPRSVELPYGHQQSQATASTSAPPPRLHTKRKSPQADAPRRTKRARSSDLSDATPPPSTPRTRESSIVSTASSSRSSTCNRSTPPTSEPPSRGSTSRSSSVHPATDEPIPRECHIDEDVVPDDAFLSSEDVVRGIMKSYVQYFKNPDDPHDRSFEPHPTNYPVGELEFPNSGATERYILLAPKDKDHYSPILDLERSLYTIVEYYLTPEQRSLFGPLPSDLLLAEDEPTPATNHLRTLRRAVHRCDGPLFLRTLDTINALLRRLKYPPLPDDAFAPPAPNALRVAVAGWANTGLPRAVALRIVEETYQRTVGPRTHELKHYQAFSDSVYGELMPPLVSRLVALSGVRPGSLLLDLGSGVGNVVLQAALQSGCTAFGVELMEKPAEMAHVQRTQMLIRARMWGLRMGEVELERANMLESARVNELMGRADVVLVNNKVFGEKLNEAIRPKFLDLKEGALVISLEPFAAPGGRVTERNVDDLGAILDVAAHDYHSMDVSWGSGAGKFYVHRVDRAGYADVRARFEAARSTRSRR
ncbi:S-adenosyl-L-methionine-dependent methyltransferase [Gloeopeniophorella convolvens]|nr:S-adenosyl-L-methionine-dependent methyltransferase [Gloeopeniophorella convolvens]